MQREDYESLHALEANLWWFAGMREITTTRVVDNLNPGKSKASTSSHEVRRTATLVSTRG